MNDEVSRNPAEYANGSTEKFDLVPGVDIDENQFDEAGYLNLHRDVATAVEKGEFPSGFYHFIRFGYREGRSNPGRSFEPRNRVIATVNASAPTQSNNIRYAFESALVSPGGGLMIVGWIDDVSDPIDTVRLASSHWRVVVDGSTLVRVRREDVEAALGGGSAHPYGFFGFLFFDKHLGLSGSCAVEIRTRSGAIIRFDLSLRRLDDVELRNIVLTYLTSAAFFGNVLVEGFACLGGGLGDQIVRFNRAITTHLLKAPYVERFGRKARRPRASLIVCLYGKAEFQFVQSCLYAGLPGIEDCELIFVSNSLELAETLLREANGIDLIYGIDQTVVVLPGNAGFGGANNAAVNAALSNRIIALNPDVFPRDPDWARKQIELADNLPAAQTRLFGAPLYYDDGSLMHGGMYFEIDRGLSITGGQPHPCPMVRVEHYGKGTPNWSQAFLQPRPVPAVTGAFISTDRAWFEQLGGFTEDYIFGHYEDADLCLKSLDKGTPAWLHDLKMWHLEGKGSTRLPPHEGGSLVNRWLFSKTWSETIEAGLRGPTPGHPLIARPPSQVAAPPLSPTPMPPAPSERKQPQLPIRGSSPRP